MNRHSQRLPTSTRYPPIRNRRHFDDGGGDGGDGSGNSVSVGPGGGVSVGDPGATSPGGFGIGDPAGAPAGTSTNSSSVGYGFGQSAANAGLGGAGASSVGAANSFGNPGGGVSVGGIGGVGGGAGGAGGGVGAPGVGGSTGSVGGGGHGGPGAASNGGVGGVSLAQMMANAQHLASIYGNGISPGVSNALAGSLGLGNNGALSQLSSLFGQQAAPLAHPDQQKFSLRATDIGGDASSASSSPSISQVSQLNSLLAHPQSSQNLGNSITSLAHTISPSVLAFMANQQTNNTANMLGAAPSTGTTMGYPSLAGVSPGLTGMPGPSPGGGSVASSPASAAQGGNSPAAVAAALANVARGGGSPTGVSAGQTAPGQQATVASPVAQQVAAVAPHAVSLGPDTGVRGGTTGSAGGRGLAAGGGLQELPKLSSPREARELPGVGPAEAPHAHKLHVGAIHSAVAGRTDHIPAHVPSGSYVLPADVVSGMGEGNTINGFKVMKRIFGGMPYGGEGNPYHQGALPYGRAKGGQVQDEGVPCVLAGGEYVVSPHHVAHIGMGDKEAGHKALDDFVVRYRAKTVKTLKKLPGPAKN